MPIDFVIRGNNNYLKIKEEHFVPLNIEILEWLKETKKLYIATSEMFDPEIKMQGAIELDDVSIGKLFAYLEMCANS